LDLFPARMMACRQQRERLFFWMRLQVASKRGSASPGRIGSDTSLSAPFHAHGVDKQGGAL
jgi:hypothetical protein